MIPTPLPPVTYAFRSAADGPFPWHVRRIDVQETLSGPFVATIDLESDDVIVDPGGMLGASATLVMTRETMPPTVRRWSGIVRAVEEPWGPDVAGKKQCRITLEPALACLKEEILTRKFQDLTVPEIVTGILKDVEGAFAREFELRLSRDTDRATDLAYPARDLCVQYGETTYDFLTRILAEEGMTHFFEQGESREKVIVVDDNVHFPESLGQVPLLPPSGKPSYREAVHQCRMTRTRAPRRSEVRGFDLTRHLPLQAARGREDGDAVGQRGDAELYEPGRSVTLFGTEDAQYRRCDVEVQARLQLERAVARTAEGHGTGDVIGFAPGLVFALDPHALSLPVPADKYLLTGVRHQGASADRRSAADKPEPDYVNTFTCIPAAVPFRPPVPAKPRAVEDWALVVSAFEADPIDTDRHGRVRVRFGYDREEGRPAHECSPWIPVSQAWAGNGYGLQIIPRAGMLVRVQYLFGDPDRPFVAGCLPTAENVLPSRLPEHKARLTLRSRSLRSGGNDRQHHNEITLDDAAEKEEVFIRAGRDYRRKVLHDERTEIDHDETRVVGHDQVLEVGGGREKTVHGDESITVKKQRTTVIQGDDTREVQGNDLLTVAKDQTLTIHGKRTTTVDKHEQASLLAGRQEEVTGDDHLHVTKTREEIADETWRAVQGPTELVLTEGNAKLHAGGHILLAVEGVQLKLESDGTAVLEANKQITVACGESSIVLAPDRVEIVASEVQLSGAAGAVKLDRSGATTSGLNVASKALLTNEITGAFVKAN